MKKTRTVTLICDCHSYDGTNRWIDVLAMHDKIILGIFKGRADFIRSAIRASDQWTYVL